MSHSDFADQYPNAEVIGTDLSPIQPDWVPPNVRFELEDATSNWTWSNDYFDFIHMRYLIGAIGDWGALFKKLGKRYLWVCIPSTSLMYR